MKMIAAVPTSNAQLRKIKKPLIERRRRERINECLTQLKTLVLEAMNRDESCYSKMEKADILEMTVAYLKSTHLNPISSSPASSLSLSQEDAKKKYLLGFNECAKEVGNYLSSMEELALKVGAPLMKHLISCFENIQRCQVGVTSTSDFLLPAAGVQSANPEDHSVSPASLPLALSDFSGTVRSGVGSAVPVALNRAPYTAMIAFCDGLRTVGKLSSSALNSPTSDVIENSSIRSSGMTSSPCIQNINSKRDQGLSGWRNSLSEEGSATELGSSCSMPVCHSVFPIPAIYTADPKMSGRFILSVPALIPVPNNTCTETVRSVKYETCNLPSDGSVWRPW